MKKIEPIIAIVLSLIGFLTIKEVLPLYLYFIIATLVGFYFFPVKLFITREKRHKGYKTPLGFMLTYNSISFLILFSIVVLYLPDSELFRNTFIVIAIINLGQFFFYIKDNKTIYVSVLHMCVALVSTVILYV
jgi:hypothetical protein